MVNKSYEEILTTISEKAPIEKQELEIKIQNKVKELDGFVTKEGAAHIVATELKVKVFDENTKTHITIKDLTPGMVNATAVGKILQKYEKREFERNGRKGAVLSLLIGDETGKTRLVFWDLNQIDKVNDEAKESDIILVRNVRVRENNGFPEVHVSNDSKFELNPKGYEIGEVTNESSTQQVNNHTEAEIQKIDDQGFYEVTGQILQVFEPRSFMACNECNKKVNEEGKCQEHPGTEATERLILNFFLDDGTSNIRCTMFTTEKESFINSANFEEEKDSLLMNWVTVKGKANVNTMTNRPEMIINQFEKTNVQEHIKKVLM